MPVGSGTSGGGARDVKAGGAYVEIYAKDGVSGVLAKVKAQVLDLAGTLRRSGLWVGGAGAAIGAGPLAYLMGGMNRSAQVAQLAEFSQQFRVPIAVMNKLKYAADQAGVSIGEVMNDHVGRFRTLIDQAPGIDPQEAQQALQIQQRFRDSTLSLQNALLPVVRLISPLVTKFAEFVKANAGLALAIGATGAGLFALGTFLTSTGTVLALVVTGVKLFGGALLTLLSPFALVLGIGAALAAGWLTLSSSGRQTASELGTAFRAIGVTFSETWGGIVNSVKAGDLAGAFKIAAVTVKAIWFELLRGLAHAFANFIEDNRAAITALAALWGGVKAAKIGGRIGGGLGGAIGFGLGAAGAGFGADALLDEAVKGKFTPGLDAKLAAAKKELADLNRNAAEKVANGEELDRARMLAELANRTQKPFTEIKGGFNLASAAQQFGYGNVTEQTELMRQMAAHTAEMAKDMAQLLLALRLR